MKLNLKHSKGKYYRVIPLTKKLLSIFVLLLLSANLIAQSSPISGTVKVSTGETAIGVSVFLKGTTIGTTTDIDGKYTLTVPDTNTKLVFSLIGYKTQEIVIGSRTTIDLTMHEDTQLLDEVVVVGYGTQKRSDLTGSVTSVRSENINKFPAANAVELLRGQAPGISVSIGDAAPGGASNILIRGKRSLSGSQTPLYIIDGMIAPHMNDLNSQDIESIEILKDASSQAIYGSRASNGVILVTTKRGKAGKVTVNVNSYLSVQDFNRNFDIYSPEEWMKLRYWGKGGTANADLHDENGNINLHAIFEDEMWVNNYKNGKFTNWEKEMLSSAILQKHDISIRGGAENLQFASSFGYLDQDGIVDGSGYKRGNMRTNVDYKPYKWLDIGMNLAFTRSETEKADSQFSRILTMPQVGSPYDEAGILQRDIGETNTNPMWQNKESKVIQTDDFLNLGANITLKPFKGLSYKFGANIRTNDRESGSYRTKLYPSTGEGSISKFRRTSYLIDNVVNYSVPFSDSEMHNLQLTLIQSVDQDRSITTGYSFMNSPADQFDWNMAADANITGATRSISQTRSVSFAGRMQYNLMGKYLVTASMRRDGASVFGENNKWANFPSVALAWRLNDEKFMEGIEWIDMLKPRISYGVVGSWGIDPYLTLGIADKKEYLLNQSLAVGYLPGASLPNPDLKWETTRSTNYGIDFSIFKGRLNTTLEYYSTTTNDLLIKRALPAITGYNSMWSNLGKTESRGFEISLNGSLIRNNNLEWNLGFSLSTQKRKLVKIDGRLDENGKPLNDLQNNWFIGKDPNVYREYVFAGIWQIGDDPQPNEYVGDKKPEPGDIRLLDYNGDGKITEDDKKLFNKDPKWYATINTSLLYKGFDVAAEFYTVQDVWKNNPYLYQHSYGGSLNGVKNGIKVNYWTPENPSNEAPRPIYKSGQVPNNTIVGMQKANYFRLRSATIGYTIPAKVTRKAYIEKARIYVTGSNIFTTTKYKSYSPEKDPTGYPEPKAYTVGVNLTF